MFARGDVRQERFEHLARIAHQRGIDGHVLVNFRAVNFDVDFARGLRVSAQIAGDAIVKTHPHGNQQIRLLNGVVDPGFAVHAHHAQIQFFVGRKAAYAQQRHSHGNVRGLHEFRKRLHRAAYHDAVPGQDQRALGGIQKLDRAIELRLIEIFLLALHRQLRRGRFPIELSGSLLRIFGNIHQHRSRPASVGNHKRFAHGPRDIFRARDNHVVLGNRHGDAGDVDFLKRVRAQQFAGNLPRDAHHRGRIEASPWQFR